MSPRRASQLPEILAISELAWRARARPYVLDMTQVHEREWLEEHRRAIGSPRRDPSVAPFLLTLFSFFGAPAVAHVWWEAAGRREAATAWVGAATFVVLVAILSFVAERLTRRVREGEVVEKLVTVVHASFPIAPALAQPFPDRLVRFDCGTFLVTPRVHAQLQPGVRYRLRCSWLWIADVEVADAVSPATPYR